MPPRQSRPTPPGFRPSVTPAGRPQPQPPHRHVRICPECAGPVARASGCVSCMQCGWGFCG